MGSEFIKYFLCHLSSYRKRVHFVVVHPQAFFSSLYFSLSHLGNSIMIYESTRRDVKNSLHAILMPRMWRTASSWLFVLLLAGWRGWLVATIMFLSRTWSITTSDNELWRVGNWNIHETDLNRMSELIRPSSSLQVLEENRFPLNL